METAYHGKKSDARDRSSEDPRRHTIPRASVSPGPRGDASSWDENDPSSVAAAAVIQQGARLRRKKSVEKAAGQRLSRERTLEREKRLSSRSRERGTTVTSTSSEAAAASSTFYRVERTVQVSRSFRDAPGMPPIPPARSNSSRRAARESVTTSTPSKKRPTPYQLWREQRLMSEMRQAWLPDGYSQILRSCVFGPSGLKDYGPAMPRCKILSLPFLGLRPHLFHPSAIQGKEGITICHLATLATGVTRAAEGVPHSSIWQDKPRRTRSL